MDTVKSDIFKRLVILGDFGDNEGCLLNALLFIEEGLEYVLQFSLEDLFLSFEDFPDI